MKFGRRHLEVATRLEVHRVILRARQGREKAEEHTTPLQNAAAQDARPAAQLQLRLEFDHRPPDGRARVGESRFFAGRDSQRCGAWRAAEGAESAVAVAAVAAVAAFDPGVGAGVTNRRRVLCCAVPPPCR